MNPATSIITKAFQNKHTSGAAIVYAVAAFGLPVIDTWFPGHTAQLDSTRRTLEALAVFYGFVAAGDAGANVAGQAPIKPISPPTETTTTPTKP